MSSHSKSTILHERDIVLKFSDVYSSPEKSKPYYNVKMAICRELVLCCLGTFCKQKSAEEQNPVFCLDAFAATGICGLLWKKELKEAVHVTVVDKVPECVTNIKENCMANDLICSEIQLDFTRIPGLPLAEQQENEICIKHADSGVVMLMEGFDFVHLDPFGCAVKFMTSAFTNLRNDGIICITSTDLASLYAIHNKVMQRNYTAHISKTDFLKEMSVRVVIASAVRSAAVCNKGLDILFTVCQEHFVLVVARVRRGPTFADACIGQIHKLLCCRLCNERAFYPDSHTPVESPYELLPCDCQKEMPGKTAVEMGPMWSGSIFDTRFITSAVCVARDLKLSARCVSLLNSLLSETQMNSTPVSNLTHHSHDMPITHHVSCDHKTKSCKHRTESCDDTTESCEHNIEPCDNNKELCNHRTESSCDHKLVSCDHERESCSNDKSSISDGFDEPASKKQKLVEDCEGVNDKKQCESVKPAANPCIPAFYYNLQRRRVRGIDMPKVNKVVCALTSAGFLASKTLFCSQSVRTNATLKQIHSIIKSKFATNKTH